MCVSSGSLSNLWSKAHAEGVFHWHTDSCQPQLFSVVEMFARRLNLVTNYSLFVAC